MSDLFPIGSSTILPAREPATTQSSAFEGYSRAEHREAAETRRNSHQSAGNRRAARKHDDENQDQFAGVLQQVLEVKASVTASSSGDGNGLTIEASSSDMKGVIASESSVLPSELQDANLLQNQGQVETPDAALSNSLKAADQNLQQKDSSAVSDLGQRQQPVSPEAKGSEQAVNGFETSAQMAGGETGGMNTANDQNAAGRLSLAQIRQRQIQNRELFLQQSPMAQAVVGKETVLSPAEQALRLSREISDIESPSIQVDGSQTGQTESLNGLLAAKEQSDSAVGFAAMAIQSASTVLPESRSMDTISQTKPASSAADAVSRSAGSESAQAPSESPVLMEVSDRRNDSFESSMSAADLAESSRTGNSPEPVLAGLGSTSVSGGPFATTLSESLSADMRLPLSNQVTTAIYEHVQKEGGRDDSSMTLRLDPPDLGELVISLTRSEDGITVRVTAREPVTMDMLLARGEEIEGRLRDQQLNLSEIEFLRPDFSGNAFQGQSGQTDQRRAEMFDIFGRSGSRRTSDNSSDSKSVARGTTSLPPLPGRLSFRA